VLLTIDHKRIPRHLLTVFIIITVAAGFLGYYYYQSQKSQITERIENELVGIANLKADQIVNWRKERLGDAETIFNNTFIVQDINHFVAGRAAPEIRKRILKWMQSFKRNDQYENILLLDTRGNLRLSAGPENQGIGPDAKKLVSEAVKTGKVGFSDLYKSKTTGEIRLSIVVPIMAVSDHKNIPVGAILLRMKPEDFLYPLLKRWHTASATAETMLVRRDGNDVLFLNSNKKGAALTLRLPIDMKELPAARAARGEEGIFEGIDYRGVKALAATKAIQDSPWHIVAKVDADEIYAPMRELGWSMALLIIGFILASGGSIALIWRNQSAQYYRSQYESELNRVALLRHYEPLTRHANDSILLFDADGNILEANERSVSMLGYSLEELLHMNVRTIGTTCALLDMDELGKKLSLSEEKGIVFESEYLRKDGATLPVEVSLKAFEIEQRTFFQTIIRDITERKKSEQRVNAMNALLDLFMKKTSKQEYLESVVNLLRIWTGCRIAGIRMLDRKGFIQYESYQGLSPDFLETENCLSVSVSQCLCIRVVLGRPDQQEASHMTPHGSFRCDNLETFLKGIPEEKLGLFRGRCIAEGFKSMAIVPIIYQGNINGVIQLADEKPDMVSAESLELIELMSPLIGEAIFRFATEEALKLSEEHYRSLIESSSDCIYQLTLDGDYLSMNSKMSAFLGNPDSSAFSGRQFVEQIAGNNEAALMAIGMAAGGDITSVRYRSVSRFGKDIWWDAVLSPVKDIDGKIISILGISRDITDRMKAEDELKSSHAQLKRLSAHLQSITEEERTRIAREVHDELGQVLTALKMDTVWLAKRLPTGQQELTDKAAVMMKLIDNVIQSVKRICTELRPTLLDHLGINAAIEWQAEEFRKRTGLKCELHLYSTSADKQISTVLFRVLQETLTNITRHAEAKKVRVMLREDEGMIILKITDNGKGITSEQMRKPQSFGLLGMRERVHSIGGTLRIRGRRNGGTAVKVMVPSVKRKT
jgi:PAS domain S-box-containing protein